MAGSIRDVENKLSDLGIIPVSTVHFGFKNVAFQFPKPRSSGLYILRIAACGTNHLNFLIVTDEKCLRLEPQRFAKLSYKKKYLDDTIAKWCHPLMYSVIVGDDKTGICCVQTCFKMLNQFLTENKDQTSLFRRRQPFF